MDIDRSLGTVTDRGRKWLTGVSWATAGVSVAYAAAYQFKPATVGHSLLGNLAANWIWALIQVGLALLIAGAQLRGGLGLKAVHALGALIQSIYLALWLVSCVITHSGYFVWPGVAFLVVGHAALSRMAWPTRAVFRGGPA